MVMAPTTGEEPVTGSAVAETPPSMAIEANLQNKDEGEGTVTLVATVSKKKQAPAEAKHSLTSSQLSFLIAASEGDFYSLTSLLSRTGDVEEGNNVPATSATAASLLEAVTMEGNTALHLLAANGSSGDCNDLERCANFINERKKCLLYKQNNKGDTPIHCAARVGKSQLVSCLVDLAKDDGKVQDLLRMTNKNNETALHEAIRRGDKEMVKVLLSADQELALFPANGTSPLYLSILVTDDRDRAILHKEDRAMIKGGDDLLAKCKKKSMVQILHDESKDGLLSYLGPNGQNTLHVAVLRGPELTRKLLRWNKDLARKKDGNGSTPLHFAADLKGALWHRESVCSQVFNANPDALFELDNNGLSPIHVAASVGAVQTIILFVKERPSSAGLRDAKGRTFLHVAIENKQVAAVYHACVNPLLLRIICLNPLLLRIRCSFQCMTPSQQAWIMNMQDNDGNTALHLAVKFGSLLMFNALFGNKKVNLNIANAEGQTPLDIAEYKVPPGLLYNQNSEVRILHALRAAGARKGASRGDHFRGSYQDIHGLKSKYESKELEKMKDLTQTQSIAAVLISTVAFGATFALPGGYRADDHTNGGTPTLAGRYAFDGFLMANTLAFIFSTGTVLCLVRGGSPVFNRNSRTVYLGVAFRLFEFSVTCFIAAFALGAFVVLSPVARKTAIAIAVMTPLTVLCDRAEFLLRRLLLVPAFWVRNGLLWTSWNYTWLVFGNMLVEFWPILLIFIWATYGRTHRISDVEPPAQAPLF